MAKTYRFVVIPKVAHPWSDEVNKGALTQAKLLNNEFGAEIIVDYLPPSVADVKEQDAILEKAAANRPNGIAVDPVDTLGNMMVINRIIERGIPIVFFDSPSPDESITSIGNNFFQQGRIAARRLANLLNGKGKVAVMQGYPSAPNHKERYEAQILLLKKYPEIKIIDGGTDNDDIETARKQALAVMQANPDLSGYLCCDASGPIGIAAAIKEAGKVGKVQVVSMDGIKPILEAIKEGVIESSSATIPRMQGSMSILMLWQKSLGMKIPQTIDTGIDVIDKDNVNMYLKDLD